MSEQTPRRRPRLRRLVPGRGALSSGLEAIGLVLIVAGVALFSVPVALIVAGLGFVVIAQVVGQ